jgi:hypothetical protein
LGVILIAPSIRHTYSHSSGSHVILRSDEPTRKAIPFHVVLSTFSAIPDAYFVIPRAFSVILSEATAPPERSRRIVAKRFDRQLPPQH